MKTVRFLFVLICAVTVLIGLAVSSQPFAKHICRFPQGEVAIFCRQTSCDCNDVGFGKIVTCDSSLLAETLPLCSGVDGISVCFQADADYVDYLVDRYNVKVVSCQQCGDVYVLCGYSTAVCGGVLLDGAKVNLQIAYRNGNVTGSPLILGGY